MIVQRDLGNPANALLPKNTLRAAGALTAAAALARG
jgi:hypothetical protein